MHLLTVACYVAGSAIWVLRSFSMRSPLWPVVKGGGGKSLNLFDAYTYDFRWFWGHQGQCLQLQLLFVWRVLHGGSAPDIQVSLAAIVYVLPPEWLTWQSGSELKISFGSACRVQQRKWVCMYISPVLLQYGYNQPVDIPSLLPTRYKCLLSVWFPSVLAYLCLWAAGIEQ